jgi:hypothetical protein
MVFVMVLLAAAVLGAAVWLLRPAADDPATPTTTAGPYLVRLSGAPPNVGVNSVVVEITGDVGQPPTPESVTVEPAMPQMGHATAPVVASRQTDGRFSADVDLSMAGQWEITVRIAADHQVHTAVLSVTTGG